MDYDTRFEISQSESFACPQELGLIKAGVNPPFLTERLMQLLFHFN